MLQCLPILYYQHDLGALGNEDSLKIEVKVVSVLSIPPISKLLGLDFAFLDLQNFYLEEGCFELLSQLF